MVAGAAAAVVVLVLRHDAYRGLITVPAVPGRFWVAAPIAIGAAAILIVTLALVGPGWYPGDLPTLVQTHSGAALITVLHYRAPYALAVGVVMVAATVAAGLVIGRRSADEQTLDQLLEQRRQREELARRRREDREQGRRRPARNDS